MVLESIISNTLNNMPGVGHAKGVFHHLTGDHTAGNEALNAASRSTAIMGASLLTGAVGAVPAAMAYDAAASLVIGEPQGYVAATKNLVEKPSVSTVLDVGLLTAGDVASGFKRAKSLQNAVKPKPKGKDTLIDAIGVAKAAYTVGNIINKAVQDTTSRPISKLIKEVPRSTVRSHEVSEENSDKEDTDEKDDLGDAFSYDEYKVDTTLPLSQEQKRQALQEKKNQTPEGHLPQNIRKHNAYRRSKEQLNESKEKFDRRDPSDRSNAIDENLWRLPVWLHVRMPHTFNYTGAVLTNTLQQGLLHIIIRHGNQLEDHIPHFETVFRRLPAQIQSMIRQIQNASTESETRNLTDRLDRALKNLDSQTSENTDKILFELQMMLYDYLQENIVLDTNNRGYLGEGCNNRRNQTVFFKVFDRQGNTQVMVLCVSDQLYHNPLCFGNDKRPVRAIITCYYITWKQYKSRQVDVLYTSSEIMHDF